MKLNLPIDAQSFQGIYNPVRVLKSLMVDGETEHLISGSKASSTAVYIERKWCQERDISELKIIAERQMAFDFLAAMEARSIATCRGAFVGPALGAVNGSMMAYVLGLTWVNPIEHDLLFERFLSMDMRENYRPSICFDLAGDVTSVLEHVRREYGASPLSSLLVDPNLSRCRMENRKELRRLENVMPDEYRDSLWRIPLNNQAAISCLGQTCDFGDGVDSSVAVKNRLMPKSFSDLVFIWTLCTTGQAELLTDTDINTVRQRQFNVNAFAEEIAHVLNASRGHLVYQEQAMKLAQTLAGFETGESYKFQKALGKGSEKAKEYKARFVNGVLGQDCFRKEDSGKLRADAECLWDEMVSCGPRLYCKAHAVCMTHISYLRTVFECDRNVKLKTETE